MTTNDPEHNKFGIFGQNVYHVTLWMTVYIYKPELEGILSWEIDFIFIAV